MMLPDIRSLKIKNVTCDSRAVRKGDLFIAVRGHDLNGREFIGDAIKKGARAVVAEEDFDCPKGVAKILVKDTRAAAPVIAADFYRHPSNRLKIVGVTGTNGKTTITYLIESIIKKSGSRAGVIGTINYRIVNRIRPAKNTTPGPLELQSMLAEMLKKGLRYAVIEVSSHSLDQRRVDCVRFDAAIFTNLTSEHLDYHKTVDNYFMAKAAIFDRLKENGVAILNNDDKKVASLKRNIKSRVITYAVKKSADIKAENVRLSLDGSRFIVNTPEGLLEINAQLIGAHNVSNILASIACGIGLGVKLSAIKKGVEALSCVPGRLESVDAGQPFKVFVDYAHTDDALFNVLNVIRQMTNKNIITVFGCGGNRDRSKRPRMGETACRLSDRVIITSDNPRFEEPRRIIDEIETGIKGEYANYDIEADRRTAIEKALNMASEDDIVVVAGKGHEDYQIMKGKILPFDDRVVVREILSRVNSE